MYTTHFSFCLVMWNTQFGCVSLTTMPHFVHSITAIFFLIQKTKNKRPKVREREDVKCESERFECGKRAT